MDKNLEMDPVKATILMVLTEFIPSFSYIKLPILKLIILSKPRHLSGLLKSCKLPRNSKCGSIERGELILYYSCKWQLMKMVATQLVQIHKKDQNQVSWSQEKLHDDGI